MAEKRTKADKLRLNTERLEKRDDAQREPEMNDETYEASAVLSRALAAVDAWPSELDQSCLTQVAILVAPKCTTLEELTLPGVGVESFPNSHQSLGGEMKRTAKHSEPRDPTPNSTELTDRISRRAYELFEARGCEHGHDREDWLQAEAEIFAERQTGMGGEPETVDRQAATAA